MKTLAIKGLRTPVSLLILGTAWMNKYTPDAACAAALDAYIEAGGNMLDTGRFYSGGYTEKFLTRWLDANGMRKQLLFSSKCCHHFVDEDNKHFLEPNRVRPEYITEDLDFSLERMKLDHFDIFMMHRDNEAVPVPELIDVLEEQARKGKISAYGLSNWSLPRLQEAMDYCAAKGYQGISTTSPSYSLAQIRKPRWVGCAYLTEEEALWHRGKDLTMIPWASQGGGFFAEAFSRENAPADYAEAYFTPDNFEKLERAKALAAKIGNGCTAVNIALAYVLSQNIPLAPIVGPRTPAEVKSCTDFLDLRLDRDQIGWLSLKSAQRPW
ncbi:aldo/keto reductase [Desulfovibrio sp. OttesenSCG-928-C06]|nr:aldo/keto reductase [Desulfovibrio sp. OttesenSCG-928-C06]